MPKQHSETGTGSRVMLNILFVAIAVSVLATLGTVMYHLVDTSYETETAIRSTANESVLFDGIYIRDENVLTYTGDGAISYTVPDGGKIAVGDVIAEIYADESAIEIQRQIDTLTEQLNTLRRISNVGTLEQAQPETLARQFTSDYEKIVQCKDEKNLTALATSEQSFLESYGTYQILIQGTQNALDNQIASISSSIATLQAGKSSKIGEVISDSSAYFISYTDGYESVLTPDTIDDLTPEKLEEILEDVNGSEKDTDTSHILGKTTSDYVWYMVGMIDNSTFKYQVGDKVTLRLTVSSAETTATIKDLKQFDDTDEVMVVLKSETMTSDFVKNRSDHVEMILGEYEGILVPRTAIRFANVDITTVDEYTGEETVETKNCRGVYIEDGEEVAFRQIDVIYEGENYVLSNLNAGSGYLKLYDSIIVEGIDADEN